MNENEQQGDARWWPEHYCEAGQLAVDPETTIGAGSAISSIRRAPSGRWWALSNLNEYGSPIHFCPYCGVSLQREVVEVMS